MQIKVIIWKNFFHFITQDLSVWEVRHLTLTKTRVDYRRYGRSDYGLMNDRYSARTSNDVRRTFNMKRRNGEFIGAFAPYGYKKDPTNKNCLIIDEVPAQVVRVFTAGM